MFGIRKVGVAAVILGTVVGCESSGDGSEADADAATPDEGGEPDADAAIPGEGGEPATATPDEGEGGRRNTPAEEASDADPCAAADLVWRSANKTNYTSYPDPGSEECVEYNGCMWAGQFAACDEQKSEDWVASHDIVAAFPDFRDLELHDLCLRKGKKTLVVTVLDTCADSDCDGCCSENQGSAEQLIDLESYTNERFDVPDGAIEWADLGPTASDGCD